MLKAKEAMSDQGENVHLVEKLKEKGILALKDKLDKIDEFDELDATKLLVDLRRLIGELLHIISLPESKLKEYNFNHDYIEELIGEAQKVKLPAEENGLV